jgi:hypothetical protein
VSKRFIVNATIAERSNTATWYAAQKPKSGRTEDSSVVPNRDWQRPEQIFPALKGWAIFNRHPVQQQFLPWQDGRVEAGAENDGNPAA